jgi:uncharacterized FAD-dependent dehydrogenase
MDQATEARLFSALRAAGAGVAMIAIAAIASGAPTTQAVEQPQATAPTVEAPGAVSGNGPTGYFPDQFVNRASEVTGHIEAF